MERQDTMELIGETIGKLRFCGHFLHFKTGGKSGRRRTLKILLRRGEILQKELQEIMEVQSGTLSEMIIGMEVDGLLEKVRSDRDGRQLLLRLTPKGREAAEREQEAYNTRICEMMSCFTPEQLEELNGLLEIMTAHWKEVEKSWGTLPRSARRSAGAARGKENL